MRYFVFKAFGNHEFDNGVDGLIRPFLQNINCSVVSANIKPDKTLAAKLSGYYQPYTIISVGLEKVAVVGYTTTETPFLSQPGKNCILMSWVGMLCHVYRGIKL